MEKVNTPAAVDTTSEIWETTKTIAATAATATATAFCVGLGTVAAYLVGAKVGQWCGIIPSQKQ